MSFMMSVRCSVIWLNHNLFSHLLHLRYKQNYNGHLCSYILHTFCIDLELCLWLTGTWKEIAYLSLTLKKSEVRQSSAGLVASHAFIIFLLFLSLLYGFHSSCFKRAAIALAIMFTFQAGGKSKVGLRRVSLFHLKNLPRIPHSTSVCYLELSLIPSTWKKGKADIQKQAATSALSVTLSPWYKLCGSGVALSKLFQGSCYMLTNCPPERWYQFKCSNMRGWPLVRLWFFCKHFMDVLKGIFLGLLSGAVS